MPQGEDEGEAARAEVSDSFAIQHTDAPSSGEQIEKSPAQEEDDALTPGERFTRASHPRAPTRSLAIRATRSAAPGVPSLLRTSANPASTSCRCRLSRSRSPTITSAILSGTTLS